RAELGRADRSLARGIRGHRPALTAGVIVMKISLKVSIVALVLSLTGSISLAGNPSVDGLNWMSGCWVSIDEEAGSGEQWMLPAGGSMLGMSRTVRDGKTVAFEFLRIAEDNDGSIVLTALPSGQQMATFAMLRQSGNEVVFENLQHDFPQRVIYRLTPEGMLVGRIEGTVNGDSRSVDFPMKQMECALAEPP
ncbi:MAG TPA: DUF6265 family protein, partial [Woeseiaceae bacterium]|nr:DUF6265 family protein [Woeseiaceae bacterium]